MLVLDVTFIKYVVYKSYIFPMQLFGIIIEETVVVMWKKILFSLVNKPCNVSDYYVPCCLEYNEEGLPIDISVSTINQRYLLYLM